MSLPAETSVSNSMISVSMNPRNPPPNFPDTSRRPPMIPTAIGTALYPLTSLKLSKDLPVEVQMRASSLKRRKNEAVTFYQNKHPQYLEFRETHGDSQHYCSICSEFVTRKQPGMALYYHSHQSSLNFRLNSDHRRSTWGEYFCPSCKVGFHYYKTGTRYPVLVTSSILKNWQGIRSMNGYEGDPLHIDQVGVAGASVEDLEHAFLAEYSHTDIPCDVLLVGGFIDLVRHRRPKQIIRDARDFKQSVLRVPDSSFAMSTLPLAPSISKLANDRYNLVKEDLTRDIIRLNHMIMEMNNEPGSMDTSRAPRFQTWGLQSTRSPRTVGPRNLLETMRAHAQEDWREWRPANQLHLSDRVRIRMGKSTVRYFQAIYGILE